MAFYLRTENNKIEFLTDEIHEIKETDLLLSQKEYEEFFELQSQGKQYRLKDIITYSIPTGLFDYVEIFETEPTAEDKVITIESLMNEINALKTELELMKTSLNL